MDELVLDDELIVTVGRVQRLGERQHAGLHVSIDLGRILAS